MYLESEWGVDKEQNGEKGCRKCWILRERKKKVKSVFWNRWRTEDEEEGRKKKDTCMMIICCADRVRGKMRYCHLYLSITEIECEIWIPNSAICEQDVWAEREPFHSRFICYGVTNDILTNLHHFYKRKKIW